MHTKDQMILLAGLGILICLCSLLFMWFVKECRLLIIHRSRSLLFTILCGGVWNGLDRLGSFRSFRTSSSWRLGSFRSRRLFRIRGQWIEWKCQDLLFCGLWLSFDRLLLGRQNLDCFGSFSALNIGSSELDMQIHWNAHIFLSCITTLQQISRILRPK